MTLRGKIDLAEMTDTGRVREHNEDAIGSNGDIGLMVLADGMGGHNAGEVASEMAVTAIRDALLDVLTPEMIDSEVIKCDDAVREAVIYANEEIFEQARTRAGCEGMGTTLVMTLFHQDKVTYANVGDSRIYRIRKN